MKNKFWRTILITGLLLTLQVSPSLAVSNKTSDYVPNNNETVVQKGDGFTVTIPKNQPNLEKSNQDSISPLSTQTYTMSLGGSGTFDGRTDGSYSSALLTDYSSISVYNQHNPIPYDDYLYAYGYMSANYYGTTNATSIVLQPSQTSYASANILQGSIPPSVSFSSQSGSSTLTWIASSPVSGKSANYYWDQWETYTNGHFTQINANDQVLWQFGTTNIGQLNTVRVNIQ